MTLRIWVEFESGPKDSHGVVPANIYIDRTSTLCYLNQETTAYLLERDFRFNRSDGPLDKDTTRYEVIPVDGYSRIVECASTPLNDRRK